MEEDPTQLIDSDGSVLFGSVKNRSGVAHVPLVLEGSSSHDAYFHVWF